MNPFRAISGFEALEKRNYLIFVVGNAVSLIGSWTNRVAASWLAWELTASPTWLGLIAFADLFPTLILGPFAGILADRFSRISVLRLAQVAAVVPAIALVVLSLANLLTIWFLFCLVLLLGAAQAVEQPSRLVLVNELVDRMQLRSAVAINSITFNLARFVGPALAGAILALSDASLAFGLNALTFVFFLVVLRLIRVPPTNLAAPARNTVFGDLKEGLQYIAAHPGIYLALSLIASLNLGARPILELLPAFADQRLQSDVIGFAVLGSSVGIGAIVGGMGINMVGQHWPNTHVALVSAAGILVSSLVFITLPWLWAAALCIAFLGVFLATSGIALQSMIQLSTAQDMRGRVLSLYGLLFRAAPAIGGLTMGILSEFLGLQWPVVFGCVLIAAALFIAYSRRAAIAQMEADGKTRLTS